MSEKKQIGTLLIIVTLIGVAGLFLEGLMPDFENTCVLGCKDVFVESYSAELYLNGSIEETFVYVIEEPGKYRMLYRNWKLPLFKERLNAPYVDEPVANSIEFFICICLA